MRGCLQSILLFFGFSCKAFSSNSIEQAMHVEKILSQMTLEEKIDYIGGYNDFSIRAIPHLEVPELKIADGPVGVRQKGSSVSYPASICIAASWDTELATKVGAMMAREARSLGIHFLLAPGMNIYRFPLCGRNFEYLGEDPFLSSRIAVALIQGIQSQKVVATAKHFLGNNQEWNRHQVSSDIDERTLREIYLPAFEASVKEGQVGAVMTSYNLVNGSYMSQNGYFINEILKKEWGFRGVVISDWNSTYDGIEAANGGLDLEMPSGAFMNKEILLAAIRGGKVLESTIDDKVRRVLRTAARFGFLDSSYKSIPVPFAREEALAVAKEAARGGTVLLKNKDMLPLEKSKIRRLAVIGPHVARAVPQGGGSSFVTPYTTPTLVDCLREIADPSTDIVFCNGVPPLSDARKACRYTTTAYGSEIGLIGEYFDNIHLEGPSSLVRTDVEIDFQWKERSYRPQGPVNSYSIRWMGYYTPTLSGEHTAYISANDGFRLYVDNELCIDNWQNPEGSFQWERLHLEAGKPYKICLEYFVDKGGQGIQFCISPQENKALKEVSAMAKTADVVVVLVGFGADHEGEDWDRAFRLPLAQDTLIKTALAANKNVVVIVTAGGNIDMASWVSDTPAILHAWYPGEGGAEALAEILFGKVNPSGKLPVTFESSLEDSACYTSYYDKDNSKHVTYSEGLFIGYRHFDKICKKPLFPFGYGLSYTTFAYSNPDISYVSEKEIKVLVRVDITNTGTCEGSEIVQVYVRDTHALAVRPEKDLKGFAKVQLAPGEKKRALITLDARAFCYYDVESKQWKFDPGEFEILLGSSSQHIEFVEKIELR